MKSDDDHGMRHITQSFDCNYILTNGGIRKGIDDTDKGMNLHSRRTMLELLLLKTVFLIGLWICRINYHYQYVRHLTFPVLGRVQGKSCYQDMTKFLILCSVQND